MGGWDSACHWDASDCKMAIASGLTCVGVACLQLEARQHALQAEASFCKPSILRRLWWVAAPLARPLRALGWWGSGDRACAHQPPLVATGRVFMDDGHSVQVSHHGTVLFVHVQTIVSATSRHFRSGCFSTTVGSAQRLLRDVMPFLLAQVSQLPGNYLHVRAEVLTCSGVSHGAVAAVFGVDPAPQEAPASLLHLAAPSGSTGSKQTLSSQHVRGCALVKQQHMCIPRL